MNFKNNLITEISEGDEQYLKYVSVWRFFDEFETDNTTFFVIL